MGNRTSDLESRHDGSQEHQLSLFNSSVCFGTKSQYKSTALIAVLDSLFHIPILCECILYADVDSTCQRADRIATEELQKLFESRAKASEGLVISIDQFVIALTASQLEGETNDFDQDDPGQVYDAISSLIITTLPDLRGVFLRDKQLKELTPSSKEAAGICITIPPNSKSNIKNIVQEKFFSKVKNIQPSPVFVITTSHSSEKSSSSITFPFSLNMKMGDAVADSLPLYSLQSVIVESMSSPNEVKSFYLIGNEWYECGHPMTKTTKEHVESLGNPESPYRVRVLIYIQGYTKTKVSKRYLNSLAQGEGLDKAAGSNSSDKPDSSSISERGEISKESNSHAERGHGITVSETGIVNYDDRMNEDIDSYDEYEDNDDPYGDDVDDYDDDDEEEENTSNTCQCPTCCRTREVKSASEKSKIERDAQERDRAEKKNSQLIKSHPGTRSVAFQKTQLPKPEKIHIDGKMVNKPMYLQSITAMEGYNKKSPEELRFEDYCSSSSALKEIKQKMDTEIVDRIREATNRLAMEREEKSMRAWAKSADRAWKKYQYAISQYERNDVEKFQAADLFTQTLKLCLTGPHSVGCYYFRALCSSSDNLSACEKDCEEALRLQPKHVEANYLLGETLYKIGLDFEKASHYIDEAYKLDPLSFPKEKLELRETVRINAQNQKMLNAAEKQKTLGNNALLKCEYTEAVRLYSNAIDIMPAGEKSHIYFCNRATAKSDLARELISGSVTAAASGNASSSKENALRDLDDALRDCEESLRLCPTYTKAKFRQFFCWGLSSYLKEENDKALHYYNGALEQDATNTLVKAEIRRVNSAIEIIKAREKAAEIEKEAKLKEALKQEEREREKAILAEKKAKEEQLRKEKEAQKELEKIERSKAKAEKDQLKAEKEKEEKLEKEREKERLKLEREAEKARKEAEKANEREQKRLQKEAEKLRQIQEKEQMDNNIKLAQQKRLEALSNANNVVLTPATPPEKSATATPVNDDSSKNDSKESEKDLKKKEDDKKDFAVPNSKAIVSAADAPKAPSSSSTATSKSADDSTSAESTPTSIKADEAVAVKTVEKPKAKVNPGNLSSISALLGAMAGPSSTSKTTTTTTPVKAVAAVEVKTTPVPVVSAAAAAAANAIHTRYMECPQPKVGLVIGAKGSIINEMMKRSQCKMCINQDFPEGQPRKVVLNGTQKQIDDARALVAAVIIHGPTVLSEPSIIEEVTALVKSGNFNALDPKYNSTAGAGFADSPSVSGGSSADRQSARNVSCRHCIPGSGYTSNDKLVACCSCNHSDLCSICALRLRIIDGDKKCPTCNTHQEYVVCWEKVQDFKSFDVPNDPISDIVLHKESSIYFPHQYFETVVKSMWQCICKECDQVYDDMNALSQHYTTVHSMLTCSLCCKNKKYFPRDLPLYASQSELDAHMTDTSKSTDHVEHHPMCLVCKERFLDKTSLLQHVNVEHAVCAICASDSSKQKFPKYFKDAKQLWDHCSADHFACSEPGCRGKVAFKSLFELKEHNKQHKVVEPPPIISSNLYDSAPIAIPPQPAHGNVHSNIHQQMANNQPVMSGNFGNNNMMNGMPSYFVNDNAPNVNVNASRSNMVNMPTQQQRPVIVPNSIVPGGGLGMGNNPMQINQMGNYAPLMSFQQESSLMGLGAGGLGNYDEFKRQVSETSIQYPQSFDFGGANQNQNPGLGGLGGNLNGNIGGNLGGMDFLSLGPSNNYISNGNGNGNGSGVGNGGLNGGMYNNSLFMSHTYGGQSKLTGSSSFESLDNSFGLGGFPSSGSGKSSILGGMQTSPPVAVGGSKIIAGNGWHDGSSATSKINFGGLDHSSLNALGQSPQLGGSDMMFNLGGLSDLSPFGGNSSSLLGGLDSFGGNSNNKKESILGYSLFDNGNDNGSNKGLQSSFSSLNDPMSFGQSGMPGVGLLNDTLGGGGVGGRNSNFLSNWGGSPANDINNAYPGNPNSSLDLGFLLPKGSSGDMEFIPGASGNGLDKRSQLPKDLMDKLIEVLKRYKEGLLGSQIPEAFFKRHGEKLVLDNGRGKRLKLLSVLDSHPNVRKEKVGNWRWFYQESPLSQQGHAPSVMVQGHRDGAVIGDALPLEFCPALAWAEEYGTNFYRVSCPVYQQIGRSGEPIATGEAVFIGLRLRPDMATILESVDGGVNSGSIVDDIRLKSGCALSMKSILLNSKIDSFIVFETEPFTSKAIASAVEMISDALKQFLSEHSDLVNMDDASLLLDESPYDAISSSIPNIVVERVHRQIDIEQKLVGLIAGKGGKKLFAMRKKSGAYMSLVSKSKSRVPGKLTISGTAEAVETALSLVRNALAETNVGNVSF